MQKLSTSLWIFVVCLWFYVARSCPPRRPSPRPCSWRTCNHGWTNPYQPGVSQGSCVRQSRSSNHIYNTHHSTAPCPGSQSCDWRTQSRTRCSCRHAYNCGLKGWTSWSGHVPNSQCATQSRFRDWSESVTYVERENNCNGVTHSCGNREYDHRTYCSCRYAYSCSLGSWTSWSGHIPYGYCSTQTRYRDWSTSLTYSYRTNNCHGVRTSCGSRENDHRKYCRCSYARCETLQWTEWKEVQTEPNHCRTEARYQRQRKTIVYKEQMNNCNGVGPQTCPQDVTSKREKVVYCSALPKPSVGKWDKSHCSQSGQLRCKTHCTLECSHLTGYRRMGSPTRTCLSTGSWSNFDAYCKDVTPPTITCPQPATYGNDPGKSFKKVTLPQVASASDNSGKMPTITTNLGSAQHDFKIARSAYEVLYTARDEAGLTAQCTWYVTIKDTEKPKTLSCPKDITQVTSKNPARVAWVEPMFKDNYDDQPIISANKVPGTQFPYGKSKVMYEALDKSGNVATCQFYVSVSPFNCPLFDAPRHGARSCNIKVNANYEHHLYCTTNCEKKYAYMSDTVFDIYQCAAGQWQGINSFPPAIHPFALTTRPWVDCIEEDSAEGVKKVINAYVGKCNENDPESLLRIKQEFLRAIDSHIISKLLYCNRHANNCDIQNVKVYCGTSKRSGGAAKQVISVEIVIRDRNSFTDKTKALKEHELMKMDLDATEIAGSKKIVAAMGIHDMHIEEYNSKLACKVGEIVHIKEGKGDELERSLCVKCGEGTYFDAEEEDCLSCAAGTYQDEEGKTSCKKCPERTWTIGSKAGNRTECIDVCEPGEFSQQGNGLANCLACPIGTYQPSFRQSKCTKCPNGKTTKVPGAASKGDCE